MKQLWFLKKCKQKLYNCKICFRHEWKWNRGSIWLWIVLCINQHEVIAVKHRFCMMSNLIVNMRKWTIAAPKAFDRRLSWLSPWSKTSKDWIDCRNVARRPPKFHSKLSSVFLAYVCSGLCTLIIAELHRGASRRRRSPLIRNDHAHLSWMLLPPNHSPPPSI